MEEMRARVATPYSKPELVSSGAEEAKGKAVLLSKRCHKKPEC